MAYRDIRVITMLDSGHGRLCSCHPVVMVTGPRMNKDCLYIYIYISVVPKHKRYVSYTYIYMYRYMIPPPFDPPLWVGNRVWRVGSLANESFTFGSIEMMNYSIHQHEKNKLEVGIFPLILAALNKDDSTPYHRTAKNP